MTKGSGRLTDDRYVTSSGPRGKGLAWAKGRRGPKTRGQRSSRVERDRAESTAARVTPFWRVILLVFCLGSLVGAAGCARVPAESVELSYIIGQDIEALHGSYTKLIRAHHAGLRREVNAAIDRVFVPALINDFVQTGELIAHAQNERTDLIELWAREAVSEIEQERQARLAPIDEAELELKESVDRAFSRVIHANSVVTAHLSSARAVEEARGEILEDLGLAGLRDRIDAALVRTSEIAADIVGDLETSSEAPEQP